MTRRPRRRFGNALLSLTALFFLIVAPRPAAAQFGGFAPPQAILITNARVHTGTGDILENASILIRRGRVARIVEGDLDADGAAVFDAAGMTVTPGLIDVHGTLGLSGGGSGGALNRAFDAFERYDTRAISDALANGVTMVYLPAVGGSISGTGAVMRLAKSGGAYGEVTAERPALCIDLDSDASALGRLNRFESIRAQFKAAKAYRESVEIYTEEQLPEYLEKLEKRAEENEKQDAEKEGGEKKDGVAALADPPERRRRRPPSGGRPGGARSGGASGGEKKEEIKKPNEPRPNRTLDVLLEAIDGTLPVRVLAQRSADILNALDLAEEYGLDITIEGGNEAALVADALAKHDVPVVLAGANPSGTYAGPRAGRRDVHAPAQLTAAGVTWAIGSGGPSRFVLMNAQLAARHAGADPIELVTSRAAGMLGLEGYGVLRRGAPADLVVWSDDPLAPASRVNRVYIDGKVVFNGEGESE